MASWRFAWRPRYSAGAFTEGKHAYDVTLALDGRDVDTVQVRANSPDEAMEKAERHLYANIYTRRLVVDGVMLRPTISDPDRRCLVCGSTKLLLQEVASHDYGTEGLRVVCAKHVSALTPASAALGGEGRSFLEEED